jgi:hypothetical protein
LEILAAKEVPWIDGSSGKGDQVLLKSVEKM